MYNKTEYETATIEAHIKSLFFIDFKPIWTVQLTMLIILPLITSATEIEILKEKDKKN